MQQVKYERFSKSNTDICKGIAICLMIAHHLFWDMPNIGYKIGEMALSQRIGIIGKVCVSIFLILSGIGIYESTKNNDKLDLILKKKTVKLYINYVFIVLISAIIGFVFLKKKWPLCCQE